MEYDTHPQEGVIRAVAMKRKLAIIGVQNGAGGRRPFSSNILIFLIFLKALLSAIHSLQYLLKLKYKWLNV